MQLKLVHGHHLFHSYEERIENRGMLGGHVSQVQVRGEESSPLSLEPDLQLMLTVLSFHIADVKLSYTEIIYRKHHFS